MMFMIVEIKGKGRGLVATRRIKKGTTIETSPLIVLNKKESKIVEKTLLGNYTFEYGDDKVCLALGYGSLFNHSTKPNVEAIMYDDSEMELFYETLRDIEAGEELVINYGYSLK